MGLIRQGMVEKSTGVTALSLTMQSGQSARIRDLYHVVPNVNTQDISVSINRKRILQFKTPASWFLLGEYASGAFSTIKEVFRKLGLFPVIPLAEGEVLTVTGTRANSFTELVYDLYDAGDVKAEEDNGSKSNRYRMFQVISNSGVLAAAGDLALDQSRLDAVFPAFPGGEVVPAGYSIELIALFGAPASRGTGAANGEYTTFLKFLADREDLFDKDLTGMNFRGDPNVVAADIDYTKSVCRLGCAIENVDPAVIVFDEPIRFGPGSELNVYTTIARTGAGGDFVAGEVCLGLLMDVIRS